MLCGQVITNTVSVLFHIMGLCPESLIRNYQVCDRGIVYDPVAGDLRARFYDFETEEPYVCDRDGIKRKPLRRSAMSEVTDIAGIHTYLNLFVGRYANYYFNLAPIITK